MQVIGWDDEPALAIELGPEELGEGDTEGIVVFLDRVVSVHRRVVGGIGIAGVTIRTVEGIIHCDGPKAQDVWDFFTGKDIEETEET